MDITVDKKAIAQASEKLKNWGRWGADDQIGTLNNVKPQDIVKAAALIRTGKVFALGIPLDRNGPQTGLFGGRWNPIHTMLATGKLGIKHSRDKMVGRGVLLDIARFRGVDCLADGYGISNAELDDCAAAQNVTVRRGDFVILRTGQLEKCLAHGWGRYAGGDAPGVKFENCYWCQDKEIAAICSDTWGVEVRPNETTEANQPWHWVVIPAMGLTMGEMFYLRELATDCSTDRVYEFFFCGPPLVITGATGSPINPQAIK